MGFPQLCIAACQPEAGIVPGAGIPAFASPRIEKWRRRPYFWDTETQSGV
jgi:hypothetical protein